MDPEILIEGNIEDVAAANYLTIYSFKRHYFITSIESIRTGLYMIRAHVDVLTTYAEALKTNNAIIAICGCMPQQKEGKYNLKEKAIEKYPDLKDYLEDRYNK